MPVFLSLLSMDSFTMTKLSSSRGNLLVVLWCFHYLLDFCSFIFLASLSSTPTKCMGELLDIFYMFNIFSHLFNLLVFFNWILIESFSLPFLLTDLEAHSFYNSAHILLIMIISENSAAFSWHPVLVGTIFLVSTL